MKELRKPDANSVISTKAPNGMPVSENVSAFGIQFVESARKLGDALDDTLNNISNYYKTELEGKVEETLEDVSRRARIIKTEFGRRANEIGEDIKSLFRKFW